MYPLLLLRKFQGFRSSVAITTDEDQVYIFSYQNITVGEDWTWKAGPEYVVPVKLCSSLWDYTYSSEDSDHFLYLFACVQPKAKLFV